MNFKTCKYTNVMSFRIGKLIIQIGWKGWKITFDL